MCLSSGTAPPLIAPLPVATWLQPSSPAPFGGRRRRINASFTQLSCFTGNPEAHRPIDSIASWVHPRSSAEFSNFAWFLGVLTVLSSGFWHSASVSWVNIFCVVCSVDVNRALKMQLRTVLDVNVVDVQKRRSPSKHYVSADMIWALSFTNVEFTLQICAETMWQVSGGGLCPEMTEMFQMDLPCNARRTNLIYVAEFSTGQKFTMQSSTFQ